MWRGDLSLTLRLGDINDPTLSPPPPLKALAIWQRLPSAHTQRGRLGLLGKYLQPSPVCSHHCLSAVSLHTCL